MTNGLDIIAEIAQGFEGKPEQARLLMKAAASTGADAAKYQLVYADELATPDYKYYDLFKSLEMPDEVWEGLASYASELGIQLHLDIFGLRSLKLAEKLEVGAIKLHGTDIANVGLLKALAESNVKRVLLGAGGAHVNEIEKAINILGNQEVVVLLGFQGYPTPNETNQIARVQLLVKRFSQSHPNIKIGFADHASPDSPLKYALAASALGAGATVLEKHITLGKVMQLEDHEAALNPDEFFEFCQVARACKDAIGLATQDDDFGMSEAEYAYRKMIRRHVVAARNLEAGKKISASDVVLKRTSSDDIITDLTSVYDKTVKSHLQVNMPISSNEII